MGRGVGIGRIHRMSPSSTNVRYRCEACGNLTRFEVTATRTTRAFHHYTVGGDLTVEDQDVISESIDSVICRWCGSGDNVVEIDESAGSASSDTGTPTAGSTDVSQSVLSSGRAGSSGGAG